MKVMKVFASTSLLLSSVFWACSTTTTPSKISKTIEIADKGNKRAVKPSSKYLFVHNSANNELIVNTIVNRNLELDCEIIQDVNKPQITWKKDGVPLAKKIFRFYYHKNLSTSFTLKFDNVMMTDSGDYECIVGVGDSRIIKIHHLFVNETVHGEKLAVHLLTPKNLEVKINEDVMLTCKGKGENEWPKFFRWDHMRRINNEELDNTSQKEIWTSPTGENYSVQTVKTDQCSDSSILEIYSAKPEHSGIYLCAVFNKNGYVTASTKLSVTTPNSTNDDGSEYSDGDLVSLIIPIICVIVLIGGIIIATYIRRAYKVRERRGTKLSCQLSTQLSSAEVDV